MDESLAVFSGVYSIVVLAIGILMLVALWKIFVKAGKPGWGAIIPFYNSYCLFEMSFGNGWLFLLCLVPCVNFIIQIIMYVKLAKAFNQSTAFAVGLIFLPFIFLPILGFGDAQYIGVSK
ncbi:MAG: hypothetical protein J6A08_13830 [Lachnospiraceae bacterium]|nr:hypothetical protein [Lachnospiraceae bacterium]